MEAVLRTRPEVPRFLTRSWVAVLALAMMVASDYKLRLRPPSESLSGRPDFTVLIEIVVYAAVAAFLLLQVAGPPRLRRPTPLLFVAWGLSLTLFATAFYAEYPSLALVRGAQLLITCGLCQAVSRRATRVQLHWLAHAYVLLVTASVLFGAAFQFPRFRLQQNRFNWLYVHPVMAGSYLGLAVVLLVCYLASRSRDRPVRWPGLVYAGLLCVNGAALLATRTRGAIAGCALGVVVAVLCSRPRRRKLDALVVMGAVAGFVTLVFGGVVLRFLERGESAETLATLNSRTELWEQAFEMVKARPLTGYGLTASRGVFVETIGLGGGHNALVNVLTDSGIFGLLWFLALLVVLAASIWQLKKRSAPVGDRTILWAVLAFLLVNSTTNEALGTPANVANIWLFVLVGWAGVLQRARLRPDQPSGSPARMPAAVTGRVGAPPPRSVSPARPAPVPPRPAPVRAGDGDGKRPVVAPPAEPAHRAAPAAPPRVVLHRFPPRVGNVWVPATSPAAARAGLSLYSACFTRARLAQLTLWWAIAVTRNTSVLGPTAAWSPPMDSGSWEHLLARWRRELGPFDTFAVHERRQPSRAGLGVLLLAGGDPVAFVKARAGDASWTLAAEL
ncbi:MAG: O-antigen ligase family protein, partial [Actinomycetota bacterium]|nr:O-antigen ligase family protein [Actinomycetota bacterium]